MDGKSTYVLLQIDSTAMPGYQSGYPLENNTKDMPAQATEYRPETKKARQMTGLFIHAALNV
ncbi:hypothetical protein QSV36_11355 [Pseudomonas sp. BCRC 81390]|uniref:hypothetical protein n=1 Tax=Pseudomonas sp. BCRC 81390 TaxID=3054778 RepID=UPI002597424A|nr:hypothetical protein [Pseudomonas sp. BCRC 81390]MDM3886186.1 hypothetical protein [Pseudomonas sp. BCRC 81390]